MPTLRIDRVDVVSDQCTGLNRIDRSSRQPLIEEPGLAPVAGRRCLGDEARHLFWRDRQKDTLQRQEVQTLMAEGKRQMGAEATKCRTRLLSD